MAMTGTPALSHICSLLFIRLMDICQTCGEFLINLEDHIEVMLKIPDWHISIQNLEISEQYFVQKYYQYTFLEELWIEDLSDTMIFL